MFVVHPLTRRSDAMISVQELEEMDHGRGPLLWDATPGVCCAAFQLGACEHTEGGWDEYDADPLSDEEQASLEAAPRGHASSTAEPF